MVGITVVQQQQEQANVDNGGGENSMLATLKARQRAAASNSAEMAIARIREWRKHIAEEDNDDSLDDDNSDSDDSLSPSTVKSSETNKDSLDEIEEDFVGSPGSSKGDSLDPSPCKPQELPKQEVVQEAPQEQQAQPVEVPQWGYEADVGYNECVKSCIATMPLRATLRKFKLDHDCPPAPPASVCSDALDVETPRETFLSTQEQMEELQRGLRPERISMGLEAHFKPEPFDGGCPSPCNTHVPLEPEDLLSIREDMFDMTPINLFARDCAYKSLHTGGTQLSSPARSIDSDELSDASTFIPATSRNHTPANGLNTFAPVNTFLLESLTERLKCLDPKPVRRKDVDGGPSTPCGRDAPSRANTPPAQSAVNATLCEDLSAKLSELMRKSR